MRLAWFSPLPPVRSGIAAYSADVLPLLGAHTIEVFVDGTNGPPPQHDSNRAGDASGLVGVRDAYDFVWKHRLDPYDLIVYQLGNAPCHDYMWAYLALYPGLVVLHDARLHHSRARRLLSRQRFEDYRLEFQYDHPDAPPGVAEYSVEGLGGSIAYFWSMLRIVMRTARAVAVHNPRVAGELRDGYPGAAVDVIRMGVAKMTDSLDIESRPRTRRELGLPDGATVFAAFGKVTAEKRIDTILCALATLRAEGADVCLLLVGDASEYGSLDSDVARLGVADRVRVTGYVPDDALSAYLGAADVCLCLRWPTAEETSASWLRCLAAARPTAISDLAHLADVPTLDPLTWEPRQRVGRPVAVSIDLLDEDASVLAAMRRLSSDRALRDELADAGHAYWREEHTLEAMASDYARVIEDAAARPAPHAEDLPAHFRRDYSDAARATAKEFGVRVDILERSGPTTDD